jgi:hypothetical protein
LLIRGQGNTCIGSNPISSGLILEGWQNGNASVLKTVVRVTPVGVQLPLPPPFKPYKEIKVMGILVLVTLTVLLLSLLKLRVSIELIIVWWEVNFFGPTYLPILYCLFVLISYLFWYLMLKLSIGIICQISTSKIKTIQTAMGNI